MNIEQSNPVSFSALGAADRGGHWRRIMYRLQLIHIHFPALSLSLSLSVCLSLSSHVFSTDLLKVRPLAKRAAPAAKILKQPPLCDIKRVGGRELFP